MVYNKFDSLKKQINANKFFYSKFYGKKYMTMKYFEKSYGYSYDFNNPITFSEKLNTRKLSKNKLYSLCADKIKVSEDFDYVGVDLYNLDGKNYFGELTFTHGAGLEKFIQIQWIKSGEDIGNKGVI